MLIVNNDKRINRYFRASEFFTEPVIGGDISEDLIQKLYNLRVALKRTIKINSGFRSEEYNKLVGGVKRSYHLKGMAVDIAYRGRKHRNALVLHAINAGFTGIGIVKDSSIWMFVLETEPSGLTHNNL